MTYGGLYDRVRMAHNTVMDIVRKAMWAIALLAAGLLQGAEGPGHCTVGGYSALSFWLGHWKVSDPNGTGTSDISLGLEGCQLIETWSAGSTFRGSNVHAYSIEDKHWHQFNVDNHGHVHTFEGVAGEHGLEYSGVSRNEAGGDVLNRMDIVNQDPSRVKVWWRKSADGGKTWTTVYDAIYTRADATK
jgi:hypothetical protein